MKQLKLDFIGKRKIFYTISIVLILAVIVYAFIFGVKLDIQFSGGAIFTYSYDGTISSDKVSEVAEKALGTEVTVQETKDVTTGKNNLKISTMQKGAVSSEAQKNLSETLQKEFKDNNIQMVDVNNVDATMGREFFAKSLLAIGVAFVLLLIYIAIRFRKIGGWSAGAFALVALFHDAFFVFATFVVFRIPLNDNFIAVILTILGYSINDTIVNFDRVRENQNIGLKLPLADLVNLSLNQTLVRTFNSSLTVIMAMLVVCIMAFAKGIESIITFAFPLLIGLLSGIYSTLFITSPLWVQWQERKANKVKKAKA